MADTLHTVTTLWHPGEEPLLNTLKNRFGRRSLGATVMAGAVLMGTVVAVAPVGAQDPTPPPTTAAPTTTPTTARPTAPPTTAPPTTVAPTSAAPTTRPPTTQAPPPVAPTTNAPGPATTPPAPQEPEGPQETLPEATLPPKQAEPEDEGGGDVGEPVTPPGNSESSGGGNTGGGAVIGENPIRELAPGVWETPVLIGGQAGVQGVSLRETVTKVRKEAESAAFTVDEQRSASKAGVIGAETAMVQSERALNEARVELERRESAAEKARKQLARMSVASYTNLYGENDPDILALTGQTMRASAVREYSGTVLVGADENQASASDGLDGAKAAVMKNTANRDSAKAALAESRKALAETEASLAKVVSEASALNLDQAPAAAPEEAPAEQPAALPDLPEGALASTTTGGDPTAGAGPDAALNALVSNDLTVTYPIAGDWNFVDSWGFERAGGKRSHKGNDLFSRYGNPVVAVEDGVVRVATNSLGGNTVYLYGRSGNRYYYAHLSAVEDGIDGQQVEVGQVMGKVGTSGNAIGTPPHLHFEVQPAGGETSNPYPMLKALAMTVAQARQGGATPTVRAQDLLVLPDQLGRTLWAEGKVRSDTLGRLGSDDWIKLINRTVLPVEALSLGDPAVAAEVSTRLGDKVDPAALPTVTGGVAPTTAPPVPIPAGAKPPMAAPPTSQAGPAG